MNIKRGVRRGVIVLTATWAVFLLLYPLYSRARYSAAVDEKLWDYYDACTAGLENCIASRDRLRNEAFPPHENAYEWFVRPNAGYVWLLFDPARTSDPYLLEFLQADIKPLPVRAYAPAYIAFPVMLILPPVMLYWFLLGIIAVGGWVTRGFKKG